MYSEDYNIAKMKRERTEKTGDKRETKGKRPQYIKLRCLGLKRKRRETPIKN